MNKNKIIGTGFMSLPFLILFIVGMIYDPTQTLAGTKIFGCIFIVVVPCVLAATHFLEKE